MKRKLAAVVIGVAMLGIAGGQPPPELKGAVPPLPVAGTGQAVDPLPTIPTLASIDQASSIPKLDLPAPAPTTAPVPPTFDALVQELQAVRTQKAELEKREKAITEALLKKFAEQKSQLEKLGVVAGLPPLTPAPKIDDIPVPAFAPQGEKKDVK
jgi:hypothetical protein